MMNGYPYTIVMAEFHTKCAEIGNIPGWSTYGECRVKTLQVAQALLLERMDIFGHKIERYTTNEVTFSDQTGQRYRFTIISTPAMATD